VAGIAQFSADKREMLIKIVGINCGGSLLEREILIQNFVKDIYTELLQRKKLVGHCKDEK